MKILERQRPFIANAVQRRGAREFYCGFGAAARNEQIEAFPAPASSDDW